MVSHGVKLFVTLSGKCFGHPLVVVLTIVINSLVVVLTILAVVFTMVMNSTAVVAYTISITGNPNSCFKAMDDGRQKN